MGFRMTAIDGDTGETKTGETENTATLIGHITELWTGFWIVPEDAETGMIVYTVTALDRFGRKASFRPFPDIGSQVYVVD